MFEKESKIVVFIFFSLFLLLGLTTFRDYGVGWDEGNNRRYGIITIDHILGKNQDARYYEKPKSFWNPTSGQFAKTHGPVFEVALVATERILNLDDKREKYLLRHIGTFLIFFVGVLLFYKLSRQIFGYRSAALVGSLFFILSPRIFAHSFYNSMDIAFMSMFVASMYTMVKYLEIKNISWAIFHAVTCAVMIDIRIAGVLIPVMTLIFALFDMTALNTAPKLPRKTVLSLSAYFSVLCLLVIFLWPMLWEDPFNNFISAFKTSARDPWGWWEIYFGKKVSGREVPWHYTPVWMLITTPPLYTILFVIGVLSLMKSMKSLKTFYTERKAQVLAFLCVLLPLIAVALFNSTLFNGWRHLYFVYPGFLIISLVGLLSTLHFIKARFRNQAHNVATGIFLVIVIFDLFFTASFMIRSHPHQVAYFNKFAGGLKNASESFQIGYWGTEYKEGLEYILKYDTSKKCRIYLSEIPATLFPVKFNANILKRSDRKRLKFVTEADKADYFMTNYCSHIPQYEFEEVWSRKIDGVKILSVFRVQ